MSSNNTVTTTVIDAARRLQDAMDSRVPCAPVRDLIGPDNIATAYAVQEQLTRARVAENATIVGRKIGLTSPAVQQQLGVDQPDFGVLFADMDYSATGAIPFGAVLQPRVEAEVAFVLGADLDGGDFEYQRVHAAIDHAVAAIEICGSRVANWDISFADTVADNASAGAYVLGDRAVSLDEFRPVDCEMEMRIDGEVVSTGTGAACLGDPISAVVWLARRAHEFGQPLRAGQVILSGALGPMRPVMAGSSVTASVTGLGSVTVAFT
ncbi:2-keto-4-pentenoate hydratase [Gordonia desulfuricans]|uniref:2-keto-4-pentenoate hydratase n=1 Tax=Gordonia desulfuricans TaxID=89051 RepID=A0A7K3LTF5_9ACTN|nr:fumarylacetoacetate hydrolase family protein [Gordonia desulfuricans]NDK91519.1 2-keto-4-pentenoate hydratase [Gordonia desulfuricans]